MNLSTLFRAYCTTRDRMEYLRQDYYVNHVDGILVEQNNPLASEYQHLDKFAKRLEDAITTQADLDSTMSAECARCEGAQRIAKECARIAETTINCRSRDPFQILVDRGKIYGAREIARAIRDKYGLEADCDYD